MNKKKRKRREKREEYAKPRTGRERLSYWKIGLTTMAATQELLSAMPFVLLKKKLIRLWNSILPEPGQPSAQLSKLICPTECRKTQHSMMWILNLLECSLSFIFDRNINIILIIYEVLKE